MTSQTPEPDGRNQTEPTPTDRWLVHLVRAGSHSYASNETPTPGDHREHVEPWLSALFQAEHLAVLLGGGLTTAVAHGAQAPPVNIQVAAFDCPEANAVNLAATRSAERLGRGEPNIEDQIRAAGELLGGLRILATSSMVPRAAEIAATWEAALDQELKRLLASILQTERGIHEALQSATERANEIRRLLGSFLLAFASRAASRERLHIFTTNYDRLVEYGCDLLGLRAIDRFVGTLAPIFRSSRLGVDMHYNPPGMRGEPRYLEGVVRLTKLHGSVDWRRENGPSGRPEVKRYSAPFGAPPDHPAFPAHPAESLLIYPNPAKDIETLEYPYAELFRDFAASVCQPNGVLVTYGYGFGDDHVNRVIRDMLTIPSTHLVIISYVDTGGRVRLFWDMVGRPEQITLLIGEHFGDLATLVEYYLPKPAIDRTTWRMVELLNRRRPQSSSVPASSTDFRDENMP